MAMPKRADDRMRPAVPRGSRAPPSRPGMREGAVLGLDETPTRPP